MANDKIPLPKFLKLLTDNNVPVKTAMSVTSKIYRDYSNPTQLRELNELKLTAAGIEDKNVRQIVLTALRKAGYVSYQTSAKRKRDREDQNAISGPSTRHAPSVPLTERPRKRKYINDLLPEPRDEAAAYDTLSFNETLDEQILKTKSVVINRAPVMMAWASIVAERLGFKREEALSIATVYTEMNAKSKGVSLGIYEQGKDKGLDAEKDGSQPYVDLMGRRMYVHFAPHILVSQSSRPLYRTQGDQWRAMADGTPASPSEAHSYISRSFRQTTPYIIGALRLLADSVPSDELNKRAWELYAQFRPSAEGWGRRFEMKCSTILEMRRAPEAVDLQ